VLSTQAVVAGISEERGLECYYIIDRSIKTDSFLEFIDLLSSCYRS